MKLQYILIIVVLSSFVPPLFLLPARNQAIVRIGDHSLIAEIADTPELREKGLAGRHSLSENEGMLFLFDSYAFEAFWMKGMRFPIDIVWIRDDVIVDIAERVPVPRSTELPIYTPREIANRVLEIQAGLVTKWGMKRGDRLMLDRK